MCLVSVNTVFFSTYNPGNWSELLHWRTSEPTILSWHELGCKPTEITVLSTDQVSVLRHWYLIKISFPTRICCWKTWKFSKIMVLNAWGFHGRKVGMGSYWIDQTNSFFSLQSTVVSVWLIIMQLCNTGNRVWLIYGFWCI